MVGYLWAAMICVSILVAGLTGNMSVITPGIFSAAEQAVSLVIGLISVMAFWLGIMKLVERSGLVEVIKTLLRPAARLLFPAIPRHHPAMSAILMNMSANLLGMGSAATPFGIKAMEEMQALNMHRKTASNEMCTFLAINTSSISLLPTTVIGLRAAAGSFNPAEIVGTTLAASICSCLAALTAERVLRGWGKFK